MVAISGIFPIHPFIKGTSLKGQTVRLQDVQKGIELLLAKFPAQEDRSKALRNLMLLFEKPLFLPEEFSQREHVRHMVVRSKKQAAQIDAIVNTAYARFTSGRFPDEISDSVAKLALPFDPTVDYHLAVSTDETGEFSPLAAFKAKMHINPQDSGAFINQLFNITDTWYLGEKNIQELSRWAAHPVFDLERLIYEYELDHGNNSTSLKARKNIQHILQLKVAAMKTVLTGAVSYGAAHSEATVCIFSEGVRDFILANNIATIRKLESTPVDSPLRQELNEHYPSYWLHGNPSIYEVKPAR